MMNFPLETKHKTQSIVFIVVSWFSLSGVLAFLFVFSLRLDLIH